MRRFSLALFLLLLVPALWAEQIGNIQFQPPNGWGMREIAANQRVYTAPDVPRGEFASIILVRGESTSRDALRASFQAAVSSVLQGKRTVQQAALSTFRTPQGYDVVGQNLTAEDRGRQVLAQFAGLNVDGRLLLVGLLTSSPEVQQGHQNAIAEFIRSIDLPATSRVSSAPLPPPSVPSNGPVRFPPPGQPKPNTVSGQLYDERGQPLRIPGARINISIWGAGANGDRNGFTIPVDANGHYESRVPHGLYGFRVYAYLPLNGNTVCVDLEPLDGRPAHVAIDSTPGIVKDWMLKLTGPMAGGNLNTIQGYHGGSITVTDGANWKEAYFGAMSRKYPAGTKVVVSLQPIGPAIDGSRVPQTLRFECDLAKMQSGQHHVGIPLATYRASAVLVAPDGRQRPLRIAMLPNLNYGSTVDVLYRPNPEDHDGRPERPNLMVLD